MIHAEKVEAKPRFLNPINFKNSINVAVIAGLIGGAFGAIIGGGITYMEMQEKVREAWVSGTLSCPGPQIYTPGEPQPIPNWPVPKSPGSVQF